ncbi:chromosome 14 C3orf67 [Pitangus sulphuratus]|nr:chromosome 14 C3orf67 [Pitangus sulphuratus]
MGGRFVEIFSAQGKNPGAKWKISGNPSAIWKEYDKELKGFVFVLEGSSQVNKMQLPKETRQTFHIAEHDTIWSGISLGSVGISCPSYVLSHLLDPLPASSLVWWGEEQKRPEFHWCNMCIDLVAFTSEIFRGAVFQSLDGIIISANCKLRKIFTLKSKPQDTAEENVTSVVPSVPRDPTDVIPRTCRLNTDVPQVTQLLNLTKIHKPEIKCRAYPLQETGSLVNRGQGNIRSGKTQDVSHIAFGSKILGPPPSSNKRVSTKVPGEVTKTSGSKSNRSSQLQNSGMPAESIHNIERLELMFSSCHDYLDQGGKRNAHQTTEDICQNDEWQFPENFTESIRLDRSDQFIASEDSACHNLNSPQNASVEHHSSETGDQQVNNKEVFTFSSRPRSAPHGKSPNMSPERYVFPLDLDPDSNRVDEKTQDNFQGTDSSEEEYDWRNYNSNTASSSELHMLASMKRQQNEELQDSGISHGLSMSWIDTCNVNISTSSDDTTETWNSFFPPLVSQEHHYQREMSPLSHSNPRDWSNVFSPPIIPGSQQLEEHTKSSTKQNIQSEDDFNAEEDEEVLTLPYDPYLNCYFDPDSGKYYELA